MDSAGEILPATVAGKRRARKTTAVTATLSMIIDSTFICTGT